MVSARARINRPVPKNNATIYVAEDDNKQVLGSTSSFSYMELWRATDGFSHKMKLGEGGFGCFYRGFLPSNHSSQGLQVAIKRITLTGRMRTSISDYIGHHEPVQSSSQACPAPRVSSSVTGGEVMLLVYDFMTNGSLDTLLHCSWTILAWSVR